MTASQCRLMRTERRQEASRVYAASRRTHADCCAGEAMRPAKGVPCQEPRKELFTVLGKERERELARAESEAWPTGMALGSDS